jgi:hypothetical protein
MDRKLETKAVKTALKAAGINATVEHGKGTAWGWLEMNVGSSEQFGSCATNEYNSHINCEPCAKINAIAKRAIEIAQQVTGRHGEYSGCILCLTQHGWDAKNKRSVEIVQPVSKSTTAALSK